MKNKALSKRLEKRLKFVEKIVDLKSNKPDNNHTFKTNNLRPVFVRG